MNEDYNYQLLSKYVDNLKVLARAYPPTALDFVAVQVRNVMYFELLMHNRGVKPVYHDGYWTVEQEDRKNTPGPLMS